MTIPHTLRFLVPAALLGLVALVPSLPPPDSASPAAPPAALPIARPIGPAGVAGEPRALKPIDAAPLPPVESQVEAGAVQPQSRKVAVIIGVYSDLAGSPLSQAQARDVFANAAASVRAYWAATSMGRLDMTTPLILGPLGLGVASCPGGNWSFSGSMNAAISQAEARGYNLDSYQHIVLWTRPPCGIPVNAGGVSDVVGRRVQLFMDWNAWPADWDPDKTAMSAIVASHELGHNMGLAHADGLDCRDGSGNQVTLSADCSRADRQDAYTGMGKVGWPYRSLLDADRLHYLGLLDSTEWQTVTAIGTYNLVPVYSASPGVRLLRIPRPAAVVSGGQSGAWTLEIRTTLAGPWDRFAATAELPDLPTVTTGVTVRYSEDQFRAQHQPGKSYLVDTTPDAGAGAADFWDATLQVGQTFADPAGGFAVTVVSVSAAGATVSIADTGAPSAPLALEGVAIAAGGAQLDWQPASDNLALAGYRVYRDAVQIGEVAAATLTYTDPPAGIGGLHTYSVAAVDTGGNVGPAVSADVTLAPPPGAPTGATALAGNGGALVAWVAPAPNGGPAVTSYTATSSPGGQTCTVAAPSAACVVMGLVNGMTYTFTVTAANSVGSGPPSDPSNQVVPLAVPGRPTGVTGVPSDHAVAISWSAPADQGSDPITLYRVTASPGGATCEVPAPATTCTIDTLTNGVAYTFTATARNLLGWSLPSEPSVPIAPRTNPDAPVNVTALASNQSAQVKWDAPPFDGGSPILAYDVVASPGGLTCHTSGIRTCVISGLTNRTWYTFTVTATNAAGPGDPSLASAQAMPLAGATYFAVVPNRLVDSRAATRLGLSASLSNKVPVSFQVTDRSTDPALNIPDSAIAVTGNLTAVYPGARGYFSLTPDQPAGVPTTSTLNFAAGDIRANNVTVKLGPGGSLWITYVGSAGKTADVVFDVTGYYAGNTSGATYVPLVPNRILDSRAPTRLGMAASLASGTPASFQVTGLDPDPERNVPASAIAVTGNLTSTNQSYKGYFSVTPERPSGIPSTSTINFPARDNRANGLTVPLGAGGVLWVTYVGAAGSTADVIFDVTGYFVAGVDGASYVPVTPNRLVDSRAGTRLGLDASLATGVPAEFAVTERSADPQLRIPAGSLAVTGNLTATNEGSRGYLALTPEDPAGVPGTSTVNFPGPDNRANGVTVRLGADGGLWVTYVGAAGTTCDAVFDVTGYFTTG